MSTELNITSLNPADVKQRLIEFLTSTGNYDDFNFEGSALNTLIDLLVRNDHYDAFLASMLANESFIQSAQIRANVSGHGQKLSYTPKTRSAARMVCDIEVTPTSLIDIPNNISMESGTMFTGASSGINYNFTNLDSYVLTLDRNTGTYKKSGVILYQGQLIKNTITHTINSPIVLKNSECDSSTIRVFVTTDNIREAFVKAKSISDLSSKSKIFFDGETYDELTELNFGRNVLGTEPNSGATVEVYYVATEVEHANGISIITPSSQIGGYVDIDVSVTSPAFGGSDRESIESIRFMAPRYYQAQNRALSPDDYSVLVKDKYPFLRSVVSWGGETAQPPSYGDVFISILTKEGEVVTDSLSRQIVSEISGKNVGSITPIVVYPKKYNLDLLIKFAFDDTATADSFNDFSVKVVSQTQQYNNDELYNFNKYYNDSKLKSLLRSINGMESLTIDKSVYTDIEVSRFENPVYKINFDNPIDVGSVSMIGYSTLIIGTGFNLYDVKGIVYSEYYLNGVKKIDEVGTVDYENGVIEFILNMVQESDIVTIYATPTEDNFYVRENRVVSISEINTELLNIKRRNQQVYEKF